MILTGFWHLTLNPLLVLCAPQYVHPTDTHRVEISDSSQKWAQISPKILDIWRWCVPDHDGRIYWSELWGMKGTYLGYQSMIVSFFDHTPLSRNLDLFLSH